MVEKIDYDKFVHSSFDECIGPAENGDHVAQARLSLLYLNGDGVPLDVGAGSQWLEKSAKDVFAINLCFKRGRARKEPGAIYGLFLMWSGGHGVPSNNKIAGKYLKQAAKMGYVQAECAMGIYHGNPYNEYGLRYSTKRSEKWLLKAQKNGSQQANYHLYLLYSKYPKPPKVNKGFRYLELAIMDGSQISLEYMGQAYEDGVATQRNLIKAAQFYYLSAVQYEHGSPYEPLMEVAAKLNKEDLSKAIAKAEEWIFNYGANAEYFDRKIQNPLHPN